MDYAQNHKVVDGVSEAHSDVLYGKGLLKLDYWAYSGNYELGCYSCNIRDRFQVTVSFRVSISRIEALIVMLNVSFVHGMTI